MTDYLLTLLLAIPTSIGVGFGISLGQDLYSWVKNRRNHIKKHINSLSQFGSNNSLYSNRNI